MIPGVGNKIVVGDFIKKGLVSCWELNESSPPTATDSHGSNDGTITGATVDQPGVSKAYDFISGESDYISFGDIGNVKSISFWVNLDSTTESIFEESSGVGVSVSGGTLSYSSWDNAFVDSVDTDTITTGWHHVVITSTTDVDLSAFSFSRVSSTYLDAAVDQIGVWTTELTTTEIEELYNSGVGLKYDYFNSGLKTNLVSLWELDETSGTNVVDSHGSNDGTNTGTADINQQGIVSNLEKAYSFDGGSDYVSIPDNSDFDLTGNVSISVWVNAISFDTDAFNTNDVLSKWYDGIQATWGLKLSDAGTQFYYRDGDDTDTDVLWVNDNVVDKWYHIVVTKTSTGSILYVDGDLKDTQGHTSDIKTNGADLWVARYKHPSYTTDYSNFKVDQLAIWERVLTPTEIDTLYNSGKGLTYSKW